MARIWANRIEARDQLFEDCPARYKAEVLRLMQEDVRNQIISKADYEDLTGLPFPDEED